MSRTAVARRVNFLIANAHALPHSSLARYCQGIGLLNVDFEYCGEAIHDDASGALKRKSVAAQKAAAKVNGDTKGLLTYFLFVSTHCTWPLTCPMTIISMGPNQLIRAPSNLK